MNPSPTVGSLARDPHVVITGRVPDVRPYVQYARLVVAPLRVARGIQNKVLEAMSMARPVLASAAAAEGLSGQAGVDFETAEHADEFVRKATALIESRHTEVMGRHARERIIAERDWSRNLAAFEALLAPRHEIVRAPRTIDSRVEHAR
jgi:glycosyltransferase involved in cell wall biosynthesis